VAEKSIRATRPIKIKNHTGLKLKRKEKMFDKLIK